MNTATLTAPARHPARRSPGSRSRRREDPPAGRLVLRRLRRRRHHAADRRRGRSARRSTCVPARPCSTSPPATAMPRSPPRAAGATSPRPTTSRRCWSAAACAPRPRAGRSNSSRPTPRRCRSPTTASTPCVSTFGVMFTANQDKAAAELLRVCKPGGKIGLANWTPDGFIGQLFKTLGKHMPPPAGVKSPALWGTRARIDEMFGAQAASIETLPRELHVPLSLGAALDGRVQDLLRAAAEDLRGARRRRRSRPCTTTSWR